MLREVIEPNAKVTEEELRSFATRHGLWLPQPYQDFLLRNNGGRPVPAAFPIKGFPDNPVGVIQAFFGLKANIETEDLEGNLIELGQNIPSGLLPIACTDGDDFVCLDLRKGSNPVVFWDRKPFWGSNVWNERDLYPVADDFQSFLDMIHDWLPQ